MSAEAGPARGRSPATPARRRVTQRVRRATVFAAAACLIAGAAVLSALQKNEKATAEEITVDRTARGSFDLVDPAGRRVTESDFRGKFMLVFFGYISCPDVCPTDLQAAGAALEALGNNGDRIQPIFITLDPERDTAEVLAAYVRHFHPRFVGLSGTPEQIAMAAQAYGVIYVMAPPRRESTGPGKPFYLIDHSAFLYLLGPDGRFVAVFPHGAGAKQLAAGMAKYLEKPSS